MIIFIVIYLLSVVGCWCWYHFIAKHAETKDLIVTLFPIGNTLFNIIWVIAGIVIFLEWLDSTNFQEKVVDKFFKL